MSFQEMLENDYTLLDKMPLQRPEFSEQDLMNLNKEEERMYLQQNSTRISEYPPFRHWTKEEHSRFLDALQIYNSNDHAKIAEHVITRNLQDVKLHAYMCSMPKKNSFLQNSNEALGLLFNSSGGLGMLGGSSSGLGMSGIGLNGSIGGLSSLSGSMSGGRIGNSLSGSLSNIPLMGGMGGMGGGMGGLGSSMGGIAGMAGMGGGMGGVNGLMGSGGVPMMGGMNGLGVMGNMGGMGNLGGMNQTVNLSNINNMGMQMHNMGMQAGSMFNPQNDQPMFPKFDSMMSEWSLEEQNAFEDALKKFPIDSANPMIAFSKIASCIPGGKRAAHDVQLRYETLLLKLGIKLESDHKPPLLHQAQGSLPTGLQIGQHMQNAGQNLHGSQGIHNGLQPAQNSPAQQHKGKASPSAAPAAGGKPPAVPKGANNPAINQGAGLPNVTAPASGAAPAKASRKRATSTTDGTQGATTKGSRKRRAKDPEEAAPQPPAPSAQAHSTAPPSTQPPSSSSAPNPSPPSSASTTPPNASQTSINAEYEKANKLLDENLELINQIAPMDTSPARVARNLELMMKIRDTITNIVNWTSNIPSSSGSTHQMPPLPVRINETLINYLSKNMPNPASANPSLSSGSSSSSSSSSSNGARNSTSTSAPLSFNQFNTSSPMFSPPMLSLPASSGFAPAPPPPLFSPSILNLTPSSGFLSPGGLLGLASPTTQQFMMGSPTLGSNK